MVCLIVCNIAVHSQKTDEIGQSTNRAGEVPINGASMAIVEALAMKDPSFTKNFDFTEQGIIGHFGVQVGFGGDGSGEVGVLEDKGRVYLVEVVMG